MKKLNLRTVVAALLALGIGSSTTGCIVAGYSSRGGGFIFPSVFGTLILVFVVILLTRRR